MHGYKSIVVLVVRNIEKIYVYAILSRVEYCKVCALCGLLELYFVTHSFF